MTFLVRIPFEVNQAIIDAREAASAEFSFEVVRATLRDSESLKAAADYVVSTLLTPANALDPLSLQTFGALNGDYIVDCLISAGGPTVTARYESRTEALTIEYHHGGDVLTVRTADSKLELLDFLAAC